MTQTSRYTVHVDGRHDPIAVRDRLHGCLSEWEVVADVHVTAGDGRYDVTVHWDTTAPEWPDEYWPMHAGDQLGRAAERVGGVTDAVVVCHDRPQDVIVEVDTTPPRPPYRLPAGDQGGAANGTQNAVDGRSGRRPAPTMGEPSQGLSEADLATIAARADNVITGEVIRCTGTGSSRRAPADASGGGRRADEGGGRDDQ